MASNTGILNRLGFANLRIWVKLVSSIGGLLILAMGVMIVWNVNAQRELALQQAKNMAMTTHHITMANLLFMKVTKTIKQRKLYYDQVRSTDTIKDLRVLRGDTVVYEMGDGDAIAMTHDDLEKEVLKTGKPIFLDTTEPKYGHVLRAIIPAIASKNYLGKNCMECHEENKAGDVMGAVSMRISLADLDKSVQSSEISLILGTLMVTVPLMLFIYFFIRSVVTRPLSGMVISLKNISSGEGDLTSRLPDSGHDEIGEASSAFNQMMNKLHALIVHVNTIAGRVIESSARLNTQSDNVAQGSETQADRSEAAAQSLEEMSASIANVAESCSHVESLSRKSRDGAQAGLQNLQNLQQSIQKVSEAVSAIVSRVESFVTRTASISSMTQQVKDIADQTNLLALNAAIEAARAGEHGRGFAVVADEVRKLAEKSTHSANEIDQITRALNADSEHVRTAIGDGLAVLESSHENMAVVANVLNQSSSSVNEVAEGMSEIRLATGEQEKASSILSSSVEDIARLARANGDAIGEMHAVVKELNDLATNLENQLSKFKT